MKINEKVYSRDGISVDTADSEPPKVRQVTNKIRANIGFK